MQIKEMTLYNLRYGKLIIKIKWSQKQHLNLEGSCNNLYRDGQIYVPRMWLFVGFKVLI